MGICEKPSTFWITRSPWKFLSIAREIDPLIPEAKTVTKTTSARPTISAAAVTAVRAGLRSAFSRASRPVSPRRRSTGQPATEASGRTSRGLTSETPSSTATAPPPIRPAAAPESSMPPKRPMQVTAIPTTPSRIASAV